MDRNPTSEGREAEQGKDAEPIVVSPQEARQGEIILNTRRRRLTFIILLVVAVAALVVLGAVVSL